MSSAGPRITLAISEDLFAWRRLGLATFLPYGGIDWESNWISYSPMALEGDGPYRLGQFSSHHRLAAPVSPWERLKIGGGTPPVLTRHGWLVIYHGVSEVEGPVDGGRPTS